MNATNGIGAINTHAISVIIYIFNIINKKEKKN